MSESSKKVKVVLVGGSGYAGFEAARLLVRHPGAELVGVFGPEGELGPMDQFYPLLSKQVALSQVLFDPLQVAALRADLAMLCVPHKVAMSYVPRLRKAGLRVIDWSADYRIHDVKEYEKWYCPHEDPAGLAEAVYGLPEHYRERIRSAGLVANPGCYPTCTILPLAPVIKAGLVEPTGIVVSAVTGISGAGRKPSLPYHFPEMNENFRPYGLGGHRHQPEMEEVLSDVTGRRVDLLFQPHVCPMDRGMLCSIYAQPTRNVSTEELLAVYKKTYAGEPFVRVRTDTLPATKDTATTNFCDVTARVAKGRVILFSALDNLVKGASGQAIQNMNIMYALDETTGLY
jgi:N-acetyl-gamma-glutamyl-phosphate reductase